MVKSSRRFESDLHPLHFITIRTDRCSCSYPITELSEVPKAQWFCLMRECGADMYLSAPGCPGCEMCSAIQERLNARLCEMNDAK